MVLRLGNASPQKHRCTNVCVYLNSISLQNSSGTSQLGPVPRLSEILCAICSGFDCRGMSQRFGVFGLFSVSHRRRNTSFGTPSALCKRWPLTISDRFWQANGPTCKISLTHLHTSPLGRRTVDITPPPPQHSVTYMVYSRGEIIYSPSSACPASCAAFVHVEYFC